MEWEIERAEGVAPEVGPGVGAPVGPIEGVSEAVDLVKTQPLIDSPATRSTTNPMRPAMRAKLTSSL